MRPDPGTIAYFCWYAAGVIARPPRWSWTTMWAAAIVVLLPTLAWLQYSWLDQIAVADRDRRERTVRTAAAQLAQEFDLELNKALFGLQVDGAMLEPRSWAAYAERYAAWSSAAANPRMVQSVYFASVTPGSAPVSTPSLRRWNSTAQRFDAAEWPSDMQELAKRIATQLEQMDRQNVFRRGDRPPTPLIPDDIGTLLAPIIHVDIDDTNVDDRKKERHGPPQVQLIGFTIVRLDLSVLTSEMLPAFVKRHFEDETGRTDFRVAVVNRDEPRRIVFESEPGAAAAALDRPDASTQLMSMHGRPFFMVARSGPGAPGSGLGFGPGRFDQTLPHLPEAPPSPGNERLTVNVIETRRDDRGATIRSRILGTAADGQWRLVAKHRAGSLEAAVAAARTRNFALSSGVLLLLSAAIGLILVSARRADRLGRQQMEFVATVSHELRTPVSVIGAAAGNLADGVVAEPARVRQYGETIQAEARRLAETVERVLQLAGIASGRSMSAVRMSPATLVDDALTACHAEIEAAGFEVDVDVPGRLPLIAGDRAALRSAMQNVIGNAVKYGRDARWLSISARATATVRSGSSARNGGGFVEITIADRGPGIPDDDRPHIFEAFYRGRHAISHQVHGNGLGLHLVQRIVEAHGGRVSVDCDAAPGCRFTIALPAVQPPVASAHGASADLLHDSTPGHVAFHPGQSN